MARSTRRDFLKASLAGTVLCGAGGLAAPAKTAKRSATDWVTLGRSNVKVTRLAFGTGTYGGRVQRELGQEEFTRLVRHAYDRGIRFFETAESYYSEIRKGFREKANHNKLESNTIFFGIICFTLAAPLFVTMGEGGFFGKAVPAVLSVLAAGATSWLQIRKPQRLWSIYRRAQRELDVV